MAKNKCGSIFTGAIVSNNNQSYYTNKNVYSLQMINSTAFEIKVLDKIFGEIDIPAGTTREFKAHPLYPVPIISLNIEFNAAAAVTDFLTLLISCSYGNFEECTSN